MRIIYTDQSFESLEESIQFLLKVQKVPLEKVLEIKNQLLDKAASLTTDPHVGQYEEYLEHLEKSHRRLIDGNFKIIYRIEEDCIYITDFFDTRQDPEKMKG
ncbi:type II toxin-antitoxin system RelE/ParE family toxin [Lunatimonas salinarum]|uniref:type II toxin-antitoxin system RelE/ParE family toxin n=1 Tax=Lunatimonas salinarum TaxID=1774590 RepID=UPI001ADFBBD5|nr:type II toxin-antitoxin system RelE/ParE family toxin [Lunatimonas salinarum]